MRTVRTLMRDAGLHTIAFTIDGPIYRTDLSGLCARVGALLGASGASVANCDVRGADPDAVTVDALARLQLAARRNGCKVRLRHASDELLALVELMGLTDAFPDEFSSRPRSQ